MNQAIRLGRPNFQKTTSVNPATLILRQTYHAPASCDVRQTFPALAKFQFFRLRQTIIACQYLDLSRVFALECIATDGIHQAYYSDIAPRRHWFAAKTN